MLAPLAFIPDEVLVTVNSLEILGIIYLAIAISALRSKIARIEGQLDEANERLQRKPR